MPLLGRLDIGPGAWEDTQLPENIAWDPASSKLGGCSAGGLLSEENTWEFHGGGSLLGLLQ